MTETNPKLKQNREEAEVCAGYLKAIGDSNRLQIVKALQSSPLAVTDLSLLLDSVLVNESCSKVSAIGIGHSNIFRANKQFDGIASFSSVGG